MTEEIKQNHSYKVSNGHAWKGGKVFDKDGYILIWSPEHPFVNYYGYVREHRLVMEQHLGRYLTKDEEIHHIDKNKQNNKIENLMLFNSNSEHRSFELRNNKRAEKDMDDRICFLCSSPKTYCRKSGRPYWRKYKNGWVCGKCNMRVVRGYLPQYADL